MTNDTDGAERLSFASPIVAVSGAAFLVVCTLLAYSMAIRSDGARACLLLEAAWAAFAIGEAVALALGVIGILRARLRGKVAGLRGALLGLGCASAFILTSLIILHSIVSYRQP